MSLATAPSTTTARTPTATTPARNDHQDAGWFQGLGLVIQRELSSRVRNRAMLASTVFLAALAAAVAGVGGHLLVDRTAATGTPPLDTEVLLAAVMTTLLVTVVTYASSSIASGVVEEKSTRVVEILLTRLSVRQLLLGKLIGCGIFTMVQLLAVGGAAAVAFTAVEGWSLVRIQPGPTLVWFLVWFVLGFVVFASLNAGLAATASRQEDLAAATNPLQLLIMLGYAAGMFFLPSAAGERWTEIASLVPMVAPFFMPIRQGLDAVTWQEQATAVLIAVVAVPLIINLAVRLYGNNVLRTGTRVSLARALADPAGAPSEQGRTPEGTTPGAPRRSAKAVRTVVSFAGGVVLVVLVLRLLG
ncbi:ABC transporter permease [Kocuria sp.]|uniref:ABC transporter permease n=1 Tax=Kocuria sp. TaxID=1871328 RepID=UPI00281172F1|nr:ABC transporter permease [Kocuria sp.]